jgi:hypothetical protein
MEMEAMTGVEYESEDAEPARERDSADVVSPVQHITGEAVVDVATTVPDSVESAATPTPNHALAAPFTGL